MERNKILSHLKESMMSGIPGIRTAGGSQKGEKGEVGPKGKLH